jgi:hypothetical protein
MLIETAATAGAVWLFALGLFVWRRRRPRRRVGDVNWLRRRL